MTQEILIKFLNDRCSEEEVKEVIRWVNKDAFTHEGVEWGLHDWNEFRESTGFLDEEQQSSLLNKIHQKIILSLNHQTNTKPVVRIFSWITKVAAVLLLPVLGILIYMLQNQPAESIASAGLTPDSLQIVTPVGSRTVVKLPDGSLVYLNHGSKLKYPQQFSGKVREVILSGEGYFDVAYDPGKPFFVNIEKLKIKAVGTKFNVSAYPGEGSIATTLVEGKVSIEPTTGSDKGKPFYSLVPGQHVNFEIQTGNIFSVKGDINKYIAWKEGKVIFENESITGVAGRLSRMFNVDIDIADEIKEYTYTVTFIDEPLFQILDLMKIATPIKYHALPRTKLPDGTFSRQKIFIEKK